MEAKCSCSDCETVACYTKHQTSQDLCSAQPLSKTCLYFNKLDKNISTFSFDDKKVAKIDSKDESFDNDENYGELFDTHSAASQEDNLCHRHISLNESSHVFSPSRAELSAQIMNFPFQNFTSSLNSNFIAPRSYASKTPFDIFEKIKEVYKACSCKVCECIIGKPQTNERCRCKPCKCEECHNMREEVTISKAISFRSIDHPPKTRKQDCQKLERTSFSKFTGREIKQACNCKPCECSQCKKISGCESSRPMATTMAFQKLVVATVESESQNRVECSCAPCTCLDCSHRYDRAASSNTRHDMSTEMTRHLGCHCTTCLNEACIPDGANACSCETRNRDRIMKKPVQRDTDFDIHRSVVTRQKNKANRGRHDLIAMFASVSKLCPEFVYQLKECTCECECVSCNYKQDSANAVKTSKVIADSNCNSNDTVTYGSLAINHELKARKSCLKANNNSSSYNCDYDVSHCDRLAKGLNRFSDIKLTENYSSTTIKCKISSNECNTRTAFCTGGVCDCMLCECERCVTRNEVIYPIKKGEKLTPAIFEHKLNRSFITFRDETVKYDANYKTLEKKARLSSTDEDYKIYVENNNPHSSKTTVFNKNIVNKFQVPNSDLCVNISKDAKKSKVYSDNTLKRDDSKYKNSNIMLNKYKNENFLPLTTNSKNARANNLLNTHNSPIFNSSAKKRLSTLNYEKKIFAEDYNFEKASLSDDVTSNLPMSKKNQNNYLISSRSESKQKLTKRAVHYSNSIEKAHRDKKKADSDLARYEIAKIDRMKYNSDYDEDYRRAQKTLKESRAFSLHLIKLLNQYEKANREFKSMDHNLMHLKHSYILPNVHPYQGLLNIEAWRTENYSNNAITKNSFQDVYAKETNINYKPRISNENLYENINERANQPGSIKPLNQSIDDEIYLNDKAISNFKHNSTKQISRDNLDKIISDGKLIESTEICSRTFSESSNHKTLQEIERDSSTTSSFNSFDMNENSIKRDKSLNLIETNKQTGEYYSVRARKKNYTQMYKEAVTESKQRKLFSTQVAKCYIANETVKEMYKPDREIDQHMTPKESKVSVAVTVSKVDKTALEEIDDSTTVKNVKSHSLIYQESNTEQTNVIFKSPMEVGVFAYLLYCFHN